MKSIQDVIRQKELELQQALESAVRAKELELVRLRQKLQEALSAVDSLLEEDTDVDGGGRMASPKALAGASQSTRASKSGGNGGGELP